MKRFTVILMSTIMLLSFPFSSIALSFQDVKESSPYREAINWAVENSITTGTSSSTFTPDASCSRAQIVTFLWRFGNKPETSSETVFSDVNESAYYYQAVNWAVEQGITLGTDEDTFSPDQACTRAQAITFLWRYADKIEPSLKYVFADIQESDYYFNPVCWGMSTGIVNGIGNGLFAPDNKCTRGQIVTFLYRYGGHPLTPVDPEEWEESNLFARMQKYYCFSSGVGGWQTTLLLNNDGTFAGNYWDGNYDESYFCNFYGGFDGVRKLDEYTYSIHLKSLKKYYPEGVSYIDQYGAICCSITEAYGMDDTDTFTVYLPGKEYSEEQIEEMMLGLYGLYNKTSFDSYVIQNDYDKSGFVGYDVGDHQEWGNLEKLTFDEASIYRAITCSRAESEDEECKVNPDSAYIYDQNNDAYIFFVGVSDSIGCGWMDVVWVSKKTGEARVIDGIQDSWPGMYEVSTGKKLYEDMYYESY